MDFTDVGIRHTILNSVELHHFIDFSPSAAVIAKETRLCVIAVVVGWITTSIVSSLCNRKCDSSSTVKPHNMMRTLASLALFATGLTAQVIESSSFGTGQTISQSRDSIPGWTLGGEGHEPIVLSDKVILTPPYPGNTRGSAWAQSPVSQSEWSAEFQFRASGPERGGGILQLWYTKEGQSRIGTSSIYTVGPFDGFALVIDTHGGRGGSVRGFLNDGTTDYKSHNSPDTLAFGHCDYSYRNLGRPSVVKLKHTSSVFKVTIDDKLCFSTDKVVLPAGNTFGITAATPENPDSFEVFKFILESATGQGSTIPSSQQPILNADPLQPMFNIRSDGMISAQDTALISTDLGRRIDLLTKANNNLIQKMESLVQNLAQKAEQRHTELAQKIMMQERQQGSINAQFDAKLSHIEQLLQNIQRDLEGKDGRFSQLQETLRSSHLSLTENLQGHLLSAITSSAPRMGFFIFCLIAFQVLLVIGYVVYKRRRANMPKKYL
ncbi:uncharacterized protein N7515_009470 [Penicillium bovifimosum]|uniref:L-type lectin-like domain-containing protein n=1 Tax=Penicillium bovifimosum TaxID=126998 RepID=A0A9W9KVQ2_9EURO|nr:uncharacterized protein N7515_009470 [Penicillium bovifimosum]KAJ5121509.1 hypothetical protein N7515_009470 [Penicillium bovifimosum]